MIKKFLYGAAVLAALSSAANAATFDFSYTFTDGQQLTGSLAGTLSGDRVTDISNVNVDFNGTAYSGTLFSGAFDSATGTYNYGANAAVVSTNAAENNFIFADSNDPVGQNVTNYFYFVNGASPSGATSGSEAFANNLNSGDIDFDGPTTGKWSLSVIPTPLPAALPLLLSGLGLVSAARRRRKDAAALA